ncbi:NAD-dependent epimerase/dehydratase family protein [Micromonospora sp. RTGN7]|uniref:NAD-dependent epimerase/dehydratase family protein n=1 Tax=Micromonospora sp. RTGN7 TaxID=3016526 RepID=UPI0029FF4CFC|nr:NAD-dependent epimerase/dehydratase family protein [Micromonospora sp. RTGN7]
MDLPELLPVKRPPNGLDPKRILVTGGAGFIGSHVVARLMLMGSRVRVVDNFSTGRIENLADAAYGGLSGDDVISGDIRTPEGVKIIHDWKPDVVVHLAAQASIPTAERTPLYDADVNVFGTVNVLDACVRSQVRLFVNATSSAIFGDVPVSELPIEENYGMAPASPYGIGKAAAIRYVDWYGRQYGLPYTSMVFSNVYGPRQGDADCGVVSLMVDALLDGRPVTINDDGRQTRDFVYVSDVAEAVALACHSEGAGLLNIASGRQTTTNEVYRAVSEAVGASNSPRYQALHESGEIRNMALDNSKAKALLGWQPTVGFTEGVRMTVRDVRRRRTGTVAMPPVQGLRVLSGR